MVFCFFDTKITKTFIEYENEFIHKISMYFFKVPAKNCCLSKRGVKIQGKGILAQKSPPDPLTTPISRLSLKV